MTIVVTGNERMGVKAMTEYISKERAQDLIVTATQGNGSRLAYMLSKLEDEPPADVVEVVHARWEAQEVGSINAYKCSNCGLITINRNIPLLRYCERCGARMDGGESNVWIHNKRTGA